MKARMSSNLGRIAILTLELFAIECGIFFPIDLFIMEKMISSSFLSYY